jgi:hypothetical protein
MSGPENPKCNFQLAFHQVWIASLNACRTAPATPWVLLSEDRHLVSLQLLFDVSMQDVKAALEKNPDTKIVFVVHGESSTGTLQPLSGLGKLCHEHGEDADRNNEGTL